MLETETSDARPIDKANYIEGCLILTVWGQYVIFLVMIDV